LIQQRHRITAAVLLAGDLLATTVAFFTAWYLRFQVEVVPLTKNAPALDRYLELLPFVLLLYPVVFYFHGLYRPRMSGSRVDEAVSVLLGVYSNLPWFLGPYYVVTTMVGAQITGHRLPPGFGMQLRNLFELSLFQGEFWSRLGVVLKPLGMSYVVGSMIGAVLLSAASYHLALAFIASRRRLHDILQHHHHHKSK